MSIVLPCSDSYLRARVTQRQHSRCNPTEHLDPVIERELALLFCSEIDLQAKIEQLKHQLESTSGFSIRRCFKAIDELNFKFIDEQSLRRFFKKVGH